MLLPVSENLRRVIIANASALQPKIQWGSALALLGALAEVESSFGADNSPRHEASFHPGGPWCHADLHKRFGCWSCCAYSSFQLQHSVSVELGFDPDRSPAELWNDDVAIHWVIEFINRRILDRGVMTVRDFAISYNGGNAKAVNPKTLNYAQKFDLAYAGVIARRNLKP